jgi:acetyl esterase/lipase
LTCEHIEVGSPPVRVLKCRPANTKGLTPAILWIHGGGLVAGDYMIDSALLFDWAERLNATVISVEYRLAPENPAPAAVDDCWTVWKWMHDEGKAVGIDPCRMVIAGGSAGAGLAAAAAQRIYDAGGVQPRLQLLIAPMLDDRTSDRDLKDSDYMLWYPSANKKGWAAYLGNGSRDNVKPYTVPARRENLSGLPPAWIGVGTLDLFYDEDLEYARRLKESGVQVSLEIVPGGFHGFETMFPKTKVGIDFKESMIVSLKHALDIV